MVSVRVHSSGHAIQGDAVIDGVVRTKTYETGDFVIVELAGIEYVCVYYKVPDEWDVRRLNSDARVATLKGEDVRQHGARSLLVNIMECAQ